MTAAECPNCRCRDRGGADWWHEDGKGFRKGRWFVKHTASPGPYGDDGWALTHDDASEPATWTKEMAPLATGLAGGIIRDFLTWHDENYPPQPAEPTGLGAVVDVPEFAPCTPGARERFTLTVESSHNQRPWVLEGDVEIRQTWAQLINRGPVTVLSEGVTS